MHGVEQECKNVYDLVVTVYLLWNLLACFDNPISISHCFTSSVVQFITESDLLRMKIVVIFQALNEVCLSLDKKFKTSAKETHYSIVFIQVFMVLKNQATVHYSALLCFKHNSNPCVKCVICQCSQTLNARNSLSVQLIFIHWYDWYWIIKVYFL